MSSGIFPKIKSVSKGNYGIAIEWNTFTISNNNLREYSIANTDGFSTIASYKYNVYGIINSYKSMHIDIHFTTEKMLIRPLFNYHYFMHASRREGRIKMIAAELLFCKRRKELTKAVRIYKENRRRKLFAELEKYIPMDICKIVESYSYSEINPVVNCKWRRSI